MRKHIILFFSALVFFASCKLDKTPPDIIKEDKMVSLLTAVHIVDGSLYNISPAPDSLYLHGSGRYTALFKQFHTDSAQFKKSFKYYSLNPEQLQKMYTEILKRLTDKQDSLNKVIAKQNPGNAVPKK